MLLRVSQATTQRLTHVSEQRCTERPTNAIDFRMNGYVALCLALKKDIFGLAGVLFGLALCRLCTIVEETLIS